MEGPRQDEVSDTEIVLKWDLPTDDGNSPIICYGVEYREAGNFESYTFQYDGSSLNLKHFLYRSNRMERGSNERRP